MALANDAIYGEDCEIPMNEYVLYTVGYGNRTVLELQYLLRANGISIVLDVRLPEKGAWMSKYRYGPEFMGKTLFPDCRYIPAGHAWGNIFLDAMVDKTAPPVKSLKNYLEWLETGQIGKRATTWAHLLLKYYEHGHTPCLLCAELDAYQKGEEGKENCHRVMVANKLSKGITDITRKPCKVQHI